MHSCMHFGVFLRANCQKIVICVIIAAVFIIITYYYYRTNYANQYQSIALHGHCVYIIQYEYILRLLHVCRQYNVQHNITAFIQSDNLKAFLLIMIITTIVCDICISLSLLFWVKQFLTTIVYQQWIQVTIKTT